MVKGLVARTGADDFSNFACRVVADVVFRDVQRGKVRKCFRYTEGPFDTSLYCNFVRMNADSIKAIRLTVWNDGKTNLDSAANTSLLRIINYQYRDFTCFHIDFRRKLT